MSFDTITGVRLQAAEAASDLLVLHRCCSGDEEAVGDWTWRSAYGVSDGNGGGKNMPGGGGLPPEPAALRSVPARDRSDRAVKGERQAGRERWRGQHRAVGSNQARTGRRRRCLGVPVSGHMQNLTA